MILIRKRNRHLLLKIIISLYVGLITKESHAEKIISTITNYFLTQRVKPKQKDYSDRLIKHHAVILAAMKVKQKASIKETKALKVAIQNLAVYYPKHEH